MRTAHATSSYSRPVVLWRFSDGKRGHDNQSLGLIEALARLVPVDARTLALPGLASTLASLVLRRFPAAANLPDPNLLIGAGHATHLPLLAAGRARGGRIIVLMKPSLPLRLFDLCIIPRHDEVGEGEGVLNTEGALNRMVPSQSHDASRGLILLGGESPHYQWKDDVVLRQVHKVVSEHPEIQWQIADSRRTPASISSALAALATSNATLVHHSAVPAEWLPTQMAHSGTVWVTEDSVSMIYEAMTSGAAVGLIELPNTKRSRVHSGIDRLVRAGYVTRFAQWSRGQALALPPQPLHEAARCARWIRDQWLQTSSEASAESGKSPHH